MLTELGRARHLLPATFVLALLLTAPGPAAQELPTPDERLSAWSATQGTAPIRATLSFGRLIPDAQLVELVRRYNVAATAVFLFSNGEFGIHRAYSGQATQDAIAAARRVLADMQSKTIEGARVRAARFVQAHSVTDVRGNVALEARMKGLLTARDVAQRIASAARAGQPTVYALEIEGSVDAVRAAGRDPVVTAFEPGLVREGRRLLPPPARPSSLPAGWNVPEIRALSAEQAYQRLQGLASEGRGR